MALTKCKECGKQISDTAKSCPSCGFVSRNSGVNQRYENTIKTYLANNYQIVSQTDNTTIMVSKEFQKEARAIASLNSVASTLGGNSQNALNNANTSYAQANVYNQIFK